MTQRVRVQNFGVSRDGIAAGEDQTLEWPFGLAVDPVELMGWAARTASWPNRTDGGGVTTLLEFLDADLIDEMHGAIAPVEFGSGVTLWDGPEDLTDRFELEHVTAASGVTHCFFWRRQRPG